MDYTEQLIDISDQLFELAEDMACDGDERCNDVEDLRKALNKIIQREM